MRRPVRLGTAIPLVAALVTLFAPRPVAAATEIVLPGRTLAAATADLDGDGANELVRLLSGSRVDDFVVEHGSLTSERWTVTGNVALPRRPSLPASAYELAGLLPLNDGPRDRLLVWRTAEDPQPETAQRCCLELGELVVGEAGVDLVALDVETAEVPMLAEALDVDGDGTDEILARAFVELPEQSWSLDLLRWDGEEALVPILQDRVDGFTNALTGNSDGIIGSDLVIGPTERGDITRISWVGGELRAETAHLDLGERFQGYTAGILDGRLVVAGTDGIRLVDWPRDGAVRIVARTDTLDFPAPSVVGTGAGALLVSVSAFDPSMAGPRATVYDRDLRAIHTIEWGETARMAWERAIGPSSGGFEGRSLFPYIGPLPAAVVGADAYLVDGTLLLAGRGGLLTQEVPAFFGTYPFGVLGPGDGWLATGDGLFSAGMGQTFFGSESTFGAGRVILTPTAAFDSGGAAGDTTIELARAVELGRTGPASRRILASGTGFDITARGPDGTIVLIADDRRLDTLTVSDGQASVTLAPPANRPRDEDAPFDMVAVIIGPDGRGAVERWSGTFVREGPAVTARGETDLLSGSATIRGDVTNGATVTVDGREVERSVTGAFTVQVEAGLLPRRVVVRAVDPFGNEATESLEVVGVVDYRVVPLPPLIALATLGFGVALFLRTPRLRRGAPQRDDDATLEELESEVG